MANNDDYESYFDSVIDDAYNPLQYEIHEPGKSDYINNLIAIWASVASSVSFLLRLM